MCDVVHSTKIKLSMNIYQHFIDLIFFIFCPTKILKIRHKLNLKLITFNIPNVRQFFKFPCK